MRAVALLALLAIAVSQGRHARAAATSDEIGAGFVGSYDQVRLRTSGSPLDAHASRIAISFRHYGKPLAEGGEPLALAPFLRRVSSWTLRAQAGYDAAPASKLEGEIGASGFRAGVGVAGELFVARWLALNFSGEYDVLDEGAAYATEVVPLVAEIALRTGELRWGLGIEGTYVRAMASDGSHDRAALRLSTELRIVFVEHIDLALGVAANGDGAEALLRVAYYPSRRLGLLGGGHGGSVRGEPPSPVAPLFTPLAELRPAALVNGAHLGCFVGASYFFTSTVGVEAIYGAAWLDGALATATDQRVVVNVLGWLH